MYPYPEMLYSTHQSGCRVQYVTLIKSSVKWYLLWHQLRRLLMLLEGESNMKGCCWSRDAVELHLCIHVLTNQQWEQLLSQLPSHCIQLLYCAALSVHRLVPHRPTSTAVVYQQDGTPTGWNAYWVATIRMCKNMCKMIPPAVSFKAHISSKSKSKRLTFQY